MIHRLVSGRPALLSLLILLTSVLTAHGGWSVGVSIGAPYCYRPCHRGPCYYRPYPVYVRPAPVFVAAPAVTVIEQVPVIAGTAAYAPVPVPAVAPVSATLPVPAVSHSLGEANPDIERHTRQLQHPDPRERAEAITQLGRLGAVGSLSSLTFALNTDRSPLVREAAARSLGLLGSTDSLEALQRAASSDEAPEVRRSSSYSADVIRAKLQRR